MRDCSVLGGCELQRALYLLGSIRWGKDVLLLCIASHSQEKKVPLSRVCKEGHPLWICCWTSLWGWFGALSKAWRAQHSGCIHVGKVFLCTPCELWKQAEMSNRNIEGKACNRGWWKPKAMEYFTSAPFSHLLSTTPWLHKKYRKETALTLWDTFHFGDMRSWRAVCPAQTLSLLDPWVRGNHCHCPFTEPAVKQCPFFSQDPFSKPPVFKETDEE